MSFTFELILPERLLISEQATAVIAPGTEGEFTVLELHAPLMSTLRPGVVTVQASESERRLFVPGGFAEVAPSGTFTILAEQAIPLEEVDAAKIEADIKDAEEQAAEALTEEARREANEKLSHLIEVRASLSP